MAALPNAQCSRSKQTRRQRKSNYRTELPIGIGIRVRACLCTGLRTGPSGRFLRAGAGSRIRRRASSLAESNRRGQNQTQCNANNVVHI